MAESQRIEELRRRIQHDPLSIAFAQLAEEHRRAGDFAASVHVCRTGLAQHPAYLSARVTLGRSLVELGRLDEALAEFEYVLHAAPDNLTASKAIADIRQRGGGRAEPRADAEATAPPMDVSATPPAIDTTASVPAVPGATVASENPPVTNAEIAATPSASITGPNPALEELEAWLQAVIDDRAAREASAASSHRRGV